MTHSVEVRPYRLQGMTTALWKLLPIEQVELEGLVFTQHHLWTLAMVNPGLSFTEDTYPYLVKYGGRYYVEDGHHRVVKAILTNVMTVQARVYDYERFGKNGADVLREQQETPRTNGSGRR